MAKPGGIARFINSLTGRLTLGLLAIHALMLPMLLAGVVLLVKEGYQNQFVNQVRLDSHLFASLLAQDQNEQRLRQLLHDAVLGGHVIYAEIITETGAVIQPEASHLAQIQFREDFFFSEHDDGVYYLAIPLYDERGKARATLRLGYDETPTLELIQRTYTRSLYFTLAYFVLSLSLTLMLAPLLTKSLRRLRDAAQRIADGNLREQLQVTTSLTEVNSLADDLEMMRRELINKSETLEYQALHDPLTGLPNRTLFDDRLEQALMEARRSGDSLAVCLMDLNRFKEINDTLGHAAGDQLLQQVALRVRGALRESDTVARLGGDEFAIVLQHVDNVQHTTHAAQKILSQMEQPMELDGHTLDITASIGIALFPDHGDDTETLLRRADLAMYEAKRAECGYALSQPQLDQARDEKFILGRELRQAINNKQLELHYQPKIDLKTRKIQGVEALMRWRHPELGLLPAAQFIPLAETTGLIHPLLLWVLDEAFSQYHIWSKAGVKLPISINLSSRNLHNPHLPDQIAARLAAWEVPAEYLRLEINESTLNLDPSRNLEILERLAALGVRLTMDNYGAAPASLAYLKKLPIQEIKIDRAILLDPELAENGVLLRMAIEIAHLLGHQVSAQGVENKELLERLSTLGCDNAQGYSLSHPMTATQLLQWLKQARHPATNTDHAGGA
ncbi:MAG: putative bifunctional diguanylate cyclase/phosphodiesterase [Gammaproteobacteria bacterium]